MRQLTFLFLLVGGLACRCAADADASSEATSVAVPVVAPVETFVDHGDLDAIVERGVLRAIVQESDEGLRSNGERSASLQRARVETFAQRHGLEVQFIPAEDFASLLTLLEEGRGDVAADDLTVTPDRQKRVAFARPFATSSEIVVGKRGADNPGTAADLDGRQVHVLEASAFKDTLEELKAETAPGLEVRFVEGNADPETIVYEVSQGLRPLTVIDSHSLAVIEKYNPDIEGLFSIADGRQIAWAVRRDNPRLKAALDAFFVEQALTEHRSDTMTGDLDEIRKRGSIRFVTRNNAVTYFLHKGRRMGFDFELAELVAKELGVRLEMVVAPSRDQLVSWLLEGRADVIGASFTITPTRAEQVAFTRPYLWVDEVVVQRTQGPKAASLEDLRGRKVHVRRSSSYHDTLLALQPAYGFELVDVPETVETEELIGMLADGEIDFTVADSHILQVETTYRDDIESAFVLSTADETDEKAEGSRGIVFATRKDNPELLSFLDDFVRRTYRGLEYNMARRKYFQNTRTIAAAKQSELERGQLSQYDPIIQKYAEQYAFDWRLLASLAYQESRFDPNAKSWVGALGLFQVMPSTGLEMGFKDLRTPDVGAHAGTLYLYKLIGRIDPRLDFKQRLRFALASYNVGLGHVLDARRLAAQKGWDPDKWFGHVEKAMLLLEKPKYHSQARHGYCRGSEPVKYVSEIQNRYDHYTELIPPRR